MSKVYFYYSAMNAGKSTMLLQSSYNYHERGMRTLLFMPKIDTRAGAGRIQSRIGLAADAIALGDDTDLFERVQADHAARPVAVGDERTTIVWVRSGPTLTCDTRAPARSSISATRRWST